MPEDTNGTDSKTTNYNDTTTTAEATTFANFDDFLKAQTDDVKKLYTDEVAGLKSALSSERQQRKDNEAALRDAAAKVDKGSEAERLLTEQADTLQGLELRAAFYDEAHTQGVTNLKLAWMAAQEADAFDKRGNVNWESLRTQFPELFAKTTMIPPGDAGKGTKSTPAGDGKDMNTFIRTSAGR